ncbi:MAG: phosphoribosylformylglycinamidine synthase I [Armatimonadota bacterium]
MAEGNGPRVALIQFPGSNCEQETKRAAEAAGIQVDMFRWNRSAERLRQYQGYLVGGGFSYQDRVRAGAVATKEPIVRTLFEEAMAGKPVLGICNGAQVLVEAGLVPGLEPGKVEMALAPNRVDPTRRISHFCCKWTFLKLTCDAERTHFTTEMEAGHVWPVPIAHGEGRFTTRDEGLLEKLVANDQIVFRYSTPEGEIVDDPVVNPNGAMDNIAGICNPQGNVLALMPHPERCSWLRQIPYEIGGEWASRRDAARSDVEALGQPGPGRAVFAAMKKGLLVPA